jgi:hypothetical protein
MWNKITSVKKKQHNTFHYQTIPTQICNYEQS